MNDWVALAKEVHGDKYDYTNSTFTNGKMTYVCRNHGLVTQPIHAHVRKGSQCKGCWAEGLNGKLRIDNKKAIDMLIAKHGDRYDYSLVKYSGNKGLVKIKCPLHGIFEQRFDHHRGGSHCQDCANTVRSEQLSHSAQEFISQSVGVHGDKYSYHGVIDVKRKTKVSIFCKECDSTFKQRVDTHLSGHGCPICNAGEVIGFKKSEFIELANIKNGGNAIFYILKCHKGSEVFYKVGITTNTVDVRYRSNKMPYSYDTIKEVEANAKDVWDLEKEHIKENSDNHYTPLMPFGGHAKECFSKLVGIT